MLCYALFSSSSAYFLFLLMLMPGFGCFLIEFSFLICLGLIFIFFLSSSRSDFLVFPLFTFYVRRFIFLNFFHLYAFLSALIYPCSDFQFLWLFLYIFPFFNFSSFFWFCFISKTLCNLSLFALILSFFLF